MQRLAVLSALLGLRAAAQLQSGPGPQLTALTRRDPTPFKTFNPSVLGNLKGVDAEAIEEMTEPRGHLFTAGVEVGSPPQRMRCLLDTGSAELWMPSKRCTNCKNNHHFHADKSSTFMPAVARTDHGMMPVPVEFGYGDGEVVGFLVQDTITLGNRVFPNQSFIIVEQEDLPTERDWDGVCGLGWKQAERAADPLYKNRAVTGTRYVFSLVPSRDGMQAFFAAGEAPMSSIRPETLVWAPAEPLNTDGELTYWLASGGMSFGDLQQDHGTPVVKSRFMVDTGTQFLLAPAKQYKAFLTALFPGDTFEQNCGIDRDAGNVVVCECAIMESLELRNVGLRLTLGATVFDLPAEQLYRRVPSTTGSDLCLLQVQKNTRMSFDPMAILGALLGLGGPPNRAPPFAMGPGGPFAMGPGGPVSLPGMTPGGGEQIEEIFHQMPDGSTCTNTLVWVQGTVRRNTTKCSDGRYEEGTAPDRRMQMLLPGGIVIPTDDPLDDVWVLGGVFLQSYVVMLDFENQRLGFAHPSWSASYGAEKYVPHQLRPRTQVPIDGRLVQTGVLGGAAPSDSAQGGSFPWGMIFFLLVVGGGAVGVKMFYKKATTRKDAVFRDEMAANEEALAARGTFEEEDMEQAENNAAE